MIDLTGYGVKDLRAFLVVKAGYDQDEADSLSKVDIAKIIRSNPKLEEALISNTPVDFDFENAELLDTDPAIPTNRPQYIPPPQEPDRPKKGSKEWNDYVLGLFTSDEYIELQMSDGGKIKGIKCDGLRRVATLLFGEPISSKPVERGVHYPDYSINQRTDQAKLKNPPFAWVQYEVIFNGPYYPITYGALADVNANNIDAKFLPFALATAETRAEARALKKALNIKILAAEELTLSDTAESVSSITQAEWEEPRLTSIQKVGITNVCKKLKLSLYKTINLSKDKDLVYFNPENVRYSSIEDLTKVAASTLMTYLNDLQQNKLKKDDSLLEE